MLAVKTSEIGTNSGNIVDIGDSNAFYAALDNPSVSEIRFTNSILLKPEGGQDSPLFIRRSVIINGNSLSLTSRLAGFILGGDVIFKNIVIEFTNPVRNAIIANGYSLTLESVTSPISSTFKISVFAGGIEETSLVGIPAQGNNPVITVRGKCNVDSIFAGSLCDVGTGITGKPITFNHRVIINIEEDADGVGSIYGSGAKEDRGTGHGNAWLPDSKFQVSQLVTVNLNNIKVKNVYGLPGVDSQGTEVVLNDKKGYTYHALLELVVRIVVKKGFLSPNKGSTFKSGGASLSVEKEGIFDFTGYLGTDFFITTFDGGGKLIFPQTGLTLNIQEDVRGVTEVAIDDANFPSMPSNKQNYIITTFDIDCKAFKLIPPSSDPTLRIRRKELSQSFAFSVPAQTGVLAQPVIKTACISFNNFIVYQNSAEMIIPIDVDYASGEEDGLEIVKGIKFSYGTETSKEEEQIDGTYIHILNIKGAECSFLFREEWSEENMFYYALTMTSLTQEYIDIPKGIYEITMTIPGVACESSTPIDVRFILEKPKSSYSIGFEDLVYVEAVKTFQISRLVYNIGSYAFKGASKTLESITFESNPQLTSIDSYAFYNCILLKEADFTQCKKLDYIGECAFMNCRSLSHFEIPSLVTTINEQSFSNSGIVSLFIGKNVDYISSNAFEYCTNLIEVTFEQRTLEISFYDTLFQGCSKLKTVEFPKDFVCSFVCFKECTSLVDITYQGGNTKYHIIDNVIYSSTETELVFCPPGKTGKYTIKEGTNSISYYGFLSSQLTEVIIPNSLSSILANAFEESQITKIVLPSKTKIIEEKAFYNCKNLISVVLPSINQIGYLCFAGCSKLKTVSLPSSITKFSGGVFNNCGNVQVDFLSSTYSINSDKFIISQGSLYQYLGHEKIITVSNHISSIERYAFAYTDISSITLSPQTNTIKTEAFYHCTKLIEIIGLERVQTLGLCAFLCCFNLRSVIKLSAASIVDMKCFENCFSIKTVLLSESTITQIHAYLFRNCYKLSTIAFPPSLTIICNNAFENCYKLREIVISSTVTEIWSEAFCNSGLSKCTFEPNSQINNLQCAFRHCMNLKTMIFPDNLKEIGSFEYEATGFRSLTIPPTVNSLIRYCFYRCNYLETLIIPKNSQISTIDSNIVYQCFHFKEIINYCDNFTVYNNALYNKNKTILYIVPLKLDLRYIAFPDTLKGINEETLALNENIRSVYLPNSIEEIGSEAFYYCTKLKVINIPISVKFIGEGAFENCISLLCGLNIENRTQEFVSELMNVGKMPKKCFEVCIFNRCFCRQYRILESQKFLFLIL